MQASHGLRRWLPIAGALLLGTILVALAAGLIWSRTGLMGAESAPLQSVRENPTVVMERADDAVILRPATHNAASRGLVFYPGAKVEPEAYASRLSGLVSREGMTVVIPEPPLRLAILDRRDLTTFTRHYPQIPDWFVGGHSMGGVRACQLAEQTQGLVLLGSYCATDLSDADIPVLSIGGQEDGLSTPEKIAEARGKLPPSALMVEIAGANHASFGDYGPQSGDGVATISDEEMTEQVTAQVSHSLLHPNR